MSNPFVLRFTLLLGAFAALPLHACEPVVPLMYVLGGPAVFAQSAVVLGIAVVTKALIFSVMQPRLPRTRAFFFMVIANALTTVIGIFVGLATSSSPLLLLASVPLVWWLSRLPCRRLVASAPRDSWLARRSSDGLASFLAIAPVLSVVLFAVAATAHVSHAYVSYWSLKLGCIYLALLVSLVLTVFWEEWAVANLAGLSGSHLFVKPVFRANAIVLSGVAVYAALRVLPLRFQRSDWLIGLFIMP